MDPPSNGAQRAGNGQFLAGHKLAKGNPDMARVRQWRRKLRNAVTPQRFGAVVETLVRSAERGEPWAIALLMDRCLGKPVQPVDIAGEVLSRYTITIELIDDRDPGYPPALEGPPEAA